MKRYLTAFFTFLGYCTFLFAMGAGIVLYIGHRKSQAAEAATMTDQHGQPVAMHPAKQADSLETPAQTLPHFEPISKKPLSATKTKTVRPKKTKKTTKPAPTVSVAPATYTTPVSAPAVSAKKPVASAKKTATRPAKKQPATTTHASLGMPAEPHRAYRATDKTSSPITRTGGGYVPNVHAAPSELELEARRKVQMEQLKQAANLIRNPPVEETGLMKLLSGGEK